ncbi:MAG: FAD-dependent oxidoreductase, partial [Candidatus Omnitrophica bacterium]|nr:FAD-dependent oxidoreductase [Candidatus Omnitrophota bacterium]
MHYVIIGNSASGVAAIEAIRESDQKGKITVISKEPYLNYSRPLISYFLGRKVKLDQMNFCQKDFFQENKVDLFLNKKVEAVDCRKKYLILSNGQRVAFDKLLIATGGVPIIPDIKGIHSKGVFTFTKLADAQKIEKFIQTNKVKTATVIGAGLIGLKATEA